MMKTWLIGILLVQVAPAKEINLSSKLISYTLCAKCGDCTGFFLDEKTILTAAHCKEKMMDRSIGSGFRISPQNILKSLNSNNLKVYKINKYTLHPSPIYNPKNRLHDIMIIKLEKNTIELLQYHHSPQFITNNNLEGKFWSVGFGNEKN